MLVSLNTSCSNAEALGCTGDGTGDGATAQATIQVAAQVTIQVTIQVTEQGTIQATAQVTTATHRPALPMARRVFLHHRLPQAAALQ
jgi:hypothetical protein